MVEEIKPKIIHFLDVRTFKSKKDKRIRYLVFKSARGEYHTFVEVEAKQAAKNCGAKDVAGDDNTRSLWRELWPD